MSNLTLSKIAFLTEGESRYALDNFDSGISSKNELRQYLDEYYRENIKLFKDIRGKKVEDIEGAVVRIIVKFKNGKELLAIFKKNTNSKRPPQQIWALVKFENKTRERDYIYEFAEFYEFNPKFGTGDKKLKELVDLALEEDWGKQNLGLVKYI